MNTFLAANTAEGFYCLFDEVSQPTDQTVLLIKGGPGTGKSTLMRKLAQAGKARGYTVEQIHCSSDPNSLDGVIFPQKHLIVLDATSPHALEPRYAGAVEQIINLGECWDRDHLLPHRDAIIRKNEEIRYTFTQIYRLLRAVGNIKEDAEGLLLPAFDNVKAERLINRTLARYPRNVPHCTAAPTRRFISALGIDGHIIYEDIFKNCKEILMIDDRFDCGHILCEAFSKKLKAAGYEQIHCLSPIQPKKIDHIVVPSLSLAIIRKNERLPIKTTIPTKVIRMQTMFEQEVVSANRNKLTLMRNICKKLYEQASLLMASEKALHDELEQFYISAMDFDKLKTKTQELIEIYL